MMPDAVPAEIASEEDLNKYTGPQEIGGQSMAAFVNDGTGTGGTGVGATPRGKVRKSKETKGGGALLGAAPAAKNKTREEKLRTIISEIKRCNNCINRGEFE